MVHNRLLLSLLVLFFFCSNGIAQRKWLQYSFGETCTFFIPETFELRNQDCAFGQFVNERVKEVDKELGEDYTNRKIVFQPIGLNEGLINASSTYARIVVSTCTISPSINQMTIKQLTPKAISAVEQNMKNVKMQTFHEMAPSGAKIIWQSFKRTLIGGKYALVSSYRQSSPQGGFTAVKEYKFFFGSHYLFIMTMYRESENEKWANDIATFIRTLQFLK